jgi:hypothetical protein
VAVPTVRHAAPVHEWPSLGIALSSADLDGSAIVAAASKSQPLWNDGGKKAEAR